jgi:hypothetical protein
MRGKPTPLERSFACAVVVLAKVVGEEAQRLATKGNLTHADVRALAELAQAINSLQRGAIWSARGILERE